MLREMHIEICHVNNLFCHKKQDTQTLYVFYWKSIVPHVKWFCSQTKQHMKNLIKLLEYKYKFIGILGTEKQLKDITGV